MLIHISLERCTEHCPATNLNSQSKPNSSDGESIRCSANEQIVISNVASGSIGVMVSLGIRVSSSNGERHTVGSAPLAISLNDSDEQFSRRVLVRKASAVYCEALSLGSQMGNETLQDQRPIVLVVQSQGPMVEGCTDSVSPGVALLH